MDKYSFLGSVHISFYDKLYDQYLDNPDSVDTTWRSFFQGYEFANESYSKKYKVISQIPPAILFDL